MVKNALVAGLLCLNLVLLGGIVLMTTSPPTALAQDEKAAEAAQAVEAAGAGPLSGNYIAVSAEIQDQYDALYMLDMASRNLYAFRYDRGRRELELIAARDLDKDFRNNREEP